MSSKSKLYSDSQTKTKRIPSLFEYNFHRDRIPARDSNETSPASLACFTVSICYFAWVLRLACYLSTNPKFRIFFYVCLVHLPQRSVSGRHISRKIQNNGIKVIVEGFLLRGEVSYGDGLGW